MLPHPSPPPELPRPRADKPTLAAPRATATHVPPPSLDEERPAALTLSAAPAQEAPRLIDRLEQAKDELGKIDAAIRRERRGLISAPPDSPELRMQRKMAQAADLAPNKWYQAPKVTEILDPGGYGRKRYKVAGALGTYCVTVESNHAPDGLDTMKNGIKPKLTNCPEHEQAATNQEW
jgi:hypothetical protein